MTEPQKYTSDSKCRAWSVAICKGPLLISENKKEKPKTQSDHLARVPATSTPALLLQVDDTKEDQRGQAPYKDRGIIENHFLTPDLSVQEVIGNQIPTSRRDTCTTKTGEYVDRDYYRLLRNTGPLPEELAHIDDEGKLLEVDARCLQYTDASFQSTFDYKSVSGY